MNKMNENIKISVVVPLFNKETSIYETLLSVLDQSFTYFELIVVDDGSTDSSLSVISKINDERLVVYSKKNGGVSDSRNFGIDKANASLIFLLDADDLIEKDCLETLYQLTNLYPKESIFCGNFEIVDSNSMVCSSKCKLNTRMLITEPLKELWKDGVFLRTGNMLVRKECFSVVGGFDIRLSYYEDMEHVLNLIRKYAVVFDPKVIFTYQLEHNYLSSKKVSLSKDWTWYASFNNKSYYEKLIIGSVVYSSLIKRFRSKDYSGCVCLLKKHFLSLHYIFGCKILKKLKLNS
jgi:glycosyltransferase involved in cell wall biosynthesis